MIQKAAVKNFVERWKDHGYEKGEAQIFWTTFLTDIFEVKNVADFIFYEQQINGKFIDALIPATNVLIEQKSSGKNLDDAFTQAKFYDNELPYNKKSRWIVTCDFQRFQIYDMNQVKPLPKIILLSELPRRCDELRFLIERTPSREEISESAGKVVRKIYDSLKKSYKVLTPEILSALNKLCVRIVFCRYADDCGIFKKDQFIETLNKYGNELAREVMIKIFEVLNTPTEKRNPNLSELLAAFPYANGSLFDGEIEIPQITSDCLYYIRSNPNNPKNFRWSNISPPIFGAIFESVLSYENTADKKNTRHEEGIHYTEIKNIHRLIDPLFLDELHDEFKACKGDKSKLKNLQDKIASLKFLDPACGSGNFLTETYLSLRRLENAIIKELGGGKVKVSISQFYGIEINNFAVAVAKTALWIAESQMLRETEEIVDEELEFLPIKTAAHIETANALKVDWPQVDYIIGNPPFIGYSFQTPQQKSDLQVVTKLKTKKIDYVAGWYFKAAEQIKNSSARAAFVSTNSVTQGEQVAIIWKPLTEKIHIDFAYKTFKWNSEATEKAQVHCVIIGFSNVDGLKKIIFDDDNAQEVTNISPYLIDAPDILIESRIKPLCDVPMMTNGSRPTDGGNLIIEAGDYDEFIKREPAAKKFILPLLGAKEFINNLPRYCLWLVDAQPDELRKMPLVMKRIDAVRKIRLQSPKAATRKAAKTPALFQEIRQPKTNFIVVPIISSENREYIPMSFLDENIIPSNLVQIIPNANIYHFGILTSSVHMVWTKSICGRFGTSYIYSGNLVYNNFVWCNPSDNQRKKIELTAQNILDVRKKFPNSSLADLYDENSMPPELRKAHEANDKAVMQAYGFDKDLPESEIVAELMKLYQKLTT